MDNLERMKLRTGESNIAVLRDCLDSARAAIMEWPDELESRYLDLQYRIAIDLYNKTGAEGQTGHTENSISRTWESSWISESLLQEVTPLAKTTS